MGYNVSMSLTILSNYVSAIATLMALFGVPVAEGDLEATIRVIAAFVALASKVLVHFGRLRVGDLNPLGGRKV